MAAMAELPKCRHWAERAQLLRQVDEHPLLKRGVPEFALDCERELSLISDLYRTAAGGPDQQRGGRA